jgi:Rieske 2Fe-2S family protein
VSPPTSGDNYDLPGAWVGGSMDPRPDAETMSLDRRSGGEFLPGVDRRWVL